ncbi:MAG: hypothetical protein ABIQ01_11710 [Pseudolysinimonas sp.]
MSDNPAPEDAVDAAAAGIATDASDQEPSALLTRLRVIEDQPLETRAESLAQLHDELRAMLEAGDARPHA